MLFSDIEGSTRLAVRLGAAWAETLDRHRSIARAAFAAHGGREIGTEGDSFFVVFDDPLDAVEAAAQFRSDLDEADWPQHDPINVRIGIHAGPVTTHGTDYVGPEVHRASRIAAGGHGRQILVSEAAQTLIVDRLPPAYALRELGKYRLKDFDAGQTIFQLDVAGVPTDFSPLRLTAFALTNLPTPRTSFVGRAREMAELREMGEAHRLVTLVGVGGTGKTRLMLELGRDLGSSNPDGVWLVELAPITDPDLIASEVARVLGAPEAPGRTSMETLVDFLRSKSLLILLDNCEHLINAAAGLADRLIAVCPNLSVVASSREGLGIPGEALFQVPSLAIPSVPAAPDEHDPDETRWLGEVTSSEAVRLFTERATIVLPSFAVTTANAAAVVGICRRLDGIPLAIELAAARVNVLSPAEIESGLDDRFGLLTGGNRSALPRQQTLQALIDWSWQLLSAPDRRALARLSVFAGGWTLAEAAALTSPGGAPVGQTLDTLTGLVERSLVQVEHGEPTRYRMLETIRQYARDRLLEMGDAAGVRDGHLDLFLALSADAAAEFHGPGMIAALHRLDLELDNVRAALDWAFEAQPEKALRLSESLSGYWRSRAYGSEALERLTRAADVVLSMPPPPDPIDVRDRQILEARVLSAGAFVLAGGHDAPIRDWSERAVTIARMVGDIELLVQTLNARTMVAALSGEVALLPRLMEETTRLAREAGDWWTVAMTEAGSVLSDLSRGDLPSAEARVQAATDAAERTGNPFAIAFAALTRGRMSGATRRVDDAHYWFGVAIRTYEQMGDRRFVVVARSDLGHALRQGGALDEAEAIYRDTIHEWQHIGNLGAIASQLERFAFIAIARGDAIRAARLLGAAEAMRETAEAPMLPHEEAEYRPQVEQLRTMIDADTRKAAWEAGRRSTPDEAISLARSGEDPPTA